MGEAVVRFSLVVFLAGTAVDWWWCNMESLFSSLFIIFGFFVCFLWRWDMVGCCCISGIIMVVWSNGSTWCLIWLFFFLFDFFFFLILLVLWFGFFQDSCNKFISCPFMFGFFTWINPSWRETTQRNGNKVALRAKNKFS